MVLYLRQNTSRMEIMTSPMFGCIEIKGNLSLEFAFSERNRFQTNDRIGRNMTSPIAI
jgi:hypothetical protein